MSGAAPVIAIDGPSGSGKGTVAHQVAVRLGFELLDSGALYRLLALAALRSGTLLDDEPALAELARGLDVRFEAPAKGGPPRPFLDGLDVEQAIRSEDCGQAASVVAGLAAVREALLERQRAFCRPPGLVADGRDMGTIVFPCAAVKIFLTATVQERANRRHNQLKEKGIDVSLLRLFDEIEARDRRDTERAVAPLRPAEDAVLIDTTGLSVEEVVEHAVAVISKANVRRTPPRAD